MSKHTYNTVLHDVNITYFIKATKRYWNKIMVYLFGSCKSFNYKCWVMIILQFIEDVIACELFFYYYNKKCDI